MSFHIFEDSLKANLTFYNGGGVTSAQTFAYGEWNHVVGVYDSGIMKIYLNGVLGQSTPSVPPDITAGTTDNRIGKLNWDSPGGSGHRGAFYGKIDEVAIWSRALTEDEILNLYLRGATRLKFQVRSCDDAACDGETFIGPDGTTNTYYTELGNSDLGLDPLLGLPTFDLLNVSDNQYFQYRTFFESDNASYSPELRRVEITLE